MTTNTKPQRLQPGARWFLGLSLALFAAAHEVAAEAISRRSQVLDNLTAASLADPERPLSVPALDRLLEPITPTSREASP